MSKRPGRPPLDKNDPSVQVSVRMPSKQMIDLCAQAQRERRTFAELLRALLRPTLPSNKKA